MLRDPHQFVSRLVTGERRTDKRLALVPLHWKPGLAPGVKLDYRLLEEAVAQKGVRVTEVGEHGSVPHLTIFNQTPDLLFLPDGTTLIGSKQNRVVNLSLLLPPESVTIIPVSCIEQRRWRNDAAQSVPKGMVDPSLRSKMCAHTVECVNRRSDVRADQQAVWSHVGAFLSAAQMESPTYDYDTAFRGSADTIADSLRRLAYPNGATGVAVLLDGQLCSIDVFDQPTTLEKLWAGMLPGALLSGLHPHQARSAKSNDVLEVLSAALAKPVGEFSAAGVGTHRRYQAAGSVGSSLEFGDVPVHVSVFGTEMAAPPANPFVQTARTPRRPWWRFR
jgi:hypothetical protein